MALSTVRVTTARLVLHWGLEPVPTGCPASGLALARLVVGVAVHRFQRVCSTPITDFLAIIATVNLLLITLRPIKRHNPQTYLKKHRLRDRSP